MKVQDIAWTEDMNLDITTIDHQHKLLAEKFEILKACARSNAETKTILSIFDELLNLMNEHFIHEEKIMSNIAYPGLEKHALVHRSVIEKIRSFRCVFEQNHKEGVISSLKFLESSISGHLSHEDRKIYDYMHRS